MSTTLEVYSRAADTHGVVDGEVVTDVAVSLVSGLGV
jgi:hypothetical protein